MIAVNRHAKVEIFTYHSEMWADKAGYNVYLPALFIYKFNASKFPDSIEHKTGDGFILNRNSNKVITKYPYGVALLQSPFWLVAHLIDKEKKGYSKIYNKVIYISAVFYFVLGLFFLYKLFGEGQDKKSIIVTFFSAIFGTNLLYYAVCETGMSHIYSFAFFSILLFLLFKKIINYQLILVSLIILIIRPINIVFLLPILLFFEVTNKVDFWLRIKALTTIKNIFLAMLLSGIIFSPQLIYNNYAFQSWGMDSYQNERFMYWRNPRILEVLFAPNNGLFLYAPVLLILLVLVVLSLRKLKKIAHLPIFLLIVYTMMYGSWWSYMLGCGFGHRGFVDILPIYIYLFYHLIKISNNKLLYILLLISCIYTTKLSFAYDGCFYGKWDWDWRAYRELLNKETR